MLKVALIGGAGYGGAEILRHMASRDDVEILRISSKDFIGKKISDVHLSLAGYCDLVVEDIPPKAAAAGADLVFLAMPHKITAAVAMELFDLPCKIIDLSGDFRLEDLAAYEASYNAKHPCPERLGSFVYGLPELNRAKIAEARYLASPGCFATAIAMGLLPLARAGLLKGRVRTVAATGSSGSGANASQGTHHPLRSQNLKGYKVLQHQHVPEIVQTLEHAGGQKIELEFVPLSAPLARGILATSFVDLDVEMTDHEITDLLHQSYDEEPFVHVVEGRSPEVVAVAGTNRVEVGWTLGPHQGDRRTVVCMSAIDNLVKGGAGQAIQSFNIMTGSPENRGFELPGLWP